MSDDVKFCKDCKYYSQKEKSASVECTSALGRTAINSRDLVTGEKRKFSSSPWDNRYRICGPEAKYFEPSTWYSIKKFLKIVK